MSFMRGNAISLVVILCAALGVSRLRAPLIGKLDSVKTKNDVYALPPPKQLVVMSLGYRSALADLIFAHTLVASGLHVQERRLFEFAGSYLEAVNELDPKFAAPYRIADGMLTLQAKPVSQDVYRQTRRILERGMAELPFDQSLWALSGQFFAYLGPSVFTDPKERDDWRLAGARAMARACELVGSHDRIPDQCVVAAGMLLKAGVATAHRELIERMLNASDDPKVRATLQAFLAKAMGNEMRDQSVARREQFQAAWASDLPFVTRGAMLIVGPAWDAGICAGLNDCATSWRAWGDSRRSALDATEAP